jgi:hypothetical protein
MCNAVIECPVSIWERESYLRRKTLLNMESERLCVAFNGLGIAEAAEREA